MYFQNGTWYHLSVHAAPKFVVVPKDIVYVGIGDNIILNCQVDIDNRTLYESKWQSHRKNNFFLTFANIENQ